MKYRILMNNKTDKLLMEISEVINAPGMTWKVRRGILRHKFKMSEDQIDMLVPRPPKGMDFPPGDY